MILVSNEQDAFCAVSMTIACMTIMETHPLGMISRSAQS